MLRGVHTFQTFARDMSIYLGRGQIMMTQQHLHDPQVGTVGEEVSRERVPQGMRRQAGLYTHRSRMALDQMPERLPGHSRAALGDEYAAARPAVQQRRARLAKITLQPRRR